MLEYRFRPSHLEQTRRHLPAFDIFLGVLPEKNLSLENGSPTLALVLDAQKKWRLVEIAL